MKPVTCRRKLPLPTQTADMQMKPCQILNQRIASLLEPRPEVLEAYLFGSHAHGRAQSHSDIDVAVYIDETVVEKSTFGYRAQLITEIMAGLHRQRHRSPDSQPGPSTLCTTMCCATATVSCPVIWRRQRRGKAVRFPDTATLFPSLQKWMRRGVFASVVNGDSRTTESLCRAAAPHRIAFRRLATCVGIRIRRPLSSATIPIFAG